MATSDGCMHLKCRCEEVNVERDNIRFCSEACADAFEGSIDATDDCPCGHADCMS